MSTIVVADLAELKADGKLREAGVRRVHALIDAKHTYQAIAAAMGIAVGTVYNIRSGRTHGWIKRELDASRPDPRIPALPSSNGPHL